MNIYRIREKISKFLNVEKNFIYVGSRGNNEKFRGKIISIYPRIFIIETSDNIIKSFSYSDFAIKNIKIC